MKSRLDSALCIVDCMLFGELESSLISVHPVNTLLDRQDLELSRRDDDYSERGGLVTESHYRCDLATI